MSALPCWLFHRAQDENDNTMSAFQWDDVNDCAEVDLVAREEWRELAEEEDGDGKEREGKRVRGWGRGSQQGSEHWGSLAAAEREEIMQKAEEVGRR
ncbi:hypothetical protein E2C01_008285 [Portunus trituberculatus]|uniref:Uncharacterized protein n=1 Tax=Portunus trituberculatus TaxID=210409 RepID=A0A5B7D5A7_PORTR|nr:hypothetical protein [Portunus trituberculatus]